jgi:hypothetical protein
MRGVFLWYDEGIEAGTEWPQVIADKIVKCDKILLFISPSSMNSNHVRQEISFANGKNKQMLPVYLEPTTLNAGVEMTISVFQAVFLYAFKNNAELFYSQLVGSLKEGFVHAGAELTELEGHHGGDALLRLDEHGDRALPPVIHLPDTGAFTIGRFDVSVGVAQSNFEFGKDTKNVSRRHAVIERGMGGYTVKDLGSKAGTWVDGIKLAPHTPCSIIPGTRVSFGNAGAGYIFERHGSD